MPRDLAWDALITVGGRLDKRTTGSLRVRARRTRSTLAWKVTEGLEVADNWTHVWEPVRSRYILGRRWRQIQSLQEAASMVETFLRERPDLDEPSS